MSLQRARYCEAQGNEAMIRAKRFPTLANHYLRLAVYYYDEAAKAAQAVLDAIPTRAENDQ